MCVTFFIYYNAISKIALVRKHKMLLKLYKMLLKLSRVYCCTPLLQLEHVDSFLMHASLPCVYPHGSGHACLPCVHSHGFAKLLKHVSMLCQSSWQSQDYLALIFSRIFSQLLKPRTIFLSQSSEAPGNLLKRMYLSSMRNTVGRQVRLR